MDIFIDIVKAFDTVNHTLVLNIEKMENIGVPPTTQ